MDDSATWHKPKPVGTIDHETMAALYAGAGGTLIGALMAARQEQPGPVRREPVGQEHDANAKLADAFTTSTSDKTGSSECTVACDPDLPRVACGGSYL